MTKKIKVKISRRAIYSSLVIVLFIAAAITVYSFNIGPPSEMGHSLDELDFSSEISNVNVWNVSVNGEATFSGAVDIDFVYTPIYIQATEMISDNYTSASNVKTHEFCLGSDYATADCIQDWGNLSGDVVDPNVINWNYDVFSVFPIEASRYYVYPGEYEYKIVMKSGDGTCWSCGRVYGTDDWGCASISCP